MHRFRVGRVRADRVCAVNERRQLQVAEQRLEDPGRLEGCGDRRGHRICGLGVYGRAGGGARGVRGAVPGAQARSSRTCGQRLRWAGLRLNYVLLRATYNAPATFHLNTLDDCGTSAFWYLAIEFFSTRSVTVRVYLGPN